MFKTYNVSVYNELDKKIKIIRSNRGGEYKSNEFLGFYFSYGIVHQMAAPYTPQQNGVVERKNRTFKDMINSMSIVMEFHTIFGVIFFLLQIPS